MMAEELKNFTRQVSNNITKMTQTHNTTQEHTGKLIENAISKALSKTQDTTASATHHSKCKHARNITYANPTYDSHQTSQLAPSPTHHITHPLY